MGVARDGGGGSASTQAKNAAARARLVAAARMTGNRYTTTAPARTGGLMGGGPRDENRLSSDMSNQKVHDLQAWYDAEINGPTDAPAAPMVPPMYPARTGTTAAKGHSGGGGSGAGSAAYLAALDAIGDGGYGQYRDDALNAYKSSFDQGNAAIDAAAAARQGGFDTRNAMLGKLQSEQDARMQSILADLNSGAATARTATAGAYGNSDAQLQQLMAQYADIAKNRDAGANQTLGAFGAQGVAPSGSGVSDMLMASRGQNQMLAGNADAAYAGRTNMYNALNSDARMSATNAYTGLQGKLAADQQESGATAAAAHASLAGNYASQQQQVQLSTAQAQQQLMLQLAQARAAALK